MIKKYDDWLIHSWELQLGLWAKHFRGLSATVSFPFMCASEPIEVDISPPSEMESSDWLVFSKDIRLLIQLGFLHPPSRTVSLRVGDFNSDYPLPWSKTNTFAAKSHQLHQWIIWAKTPYEKFSEKRQIKSASRIDQWMPIVKVQYNRSDLN